jgi:hypothetical protein
MNRGLSGTWGEVLWACRLLVETRGRAVLAYKLVNTRGGSGGAATEEGVGGVGFEGCGEGGACEEAVNVGDTPGEGLWREDIRIVH